MSKKKARRTTHRSTKGKKLYARRSRAGQFKDIQTFKRAHGKDIRSRSRVERQAQKIADLKILNANLRRTVRLLEARLDGTGL